MADNSEIERVLVTGASGYIAAHIIQQLQQAGYAVRGTVRSLENEAKNKHLKGLCPDAAHELELVEAELLNEESWKSAVDGCMYVIHTASPFPLSIPSDENTLIKPAVEGVTSVLKACVASGKVKRVVLTSAGLAIIGAVTSGEFSEKDWPANVDKLDPYAKSKTLAEKAAWEFVENLKEDEKFEFVVVNPVGVVGPVLSSNKSTSTVIIKRLLERNPFLVPKFNLPLVDVRDVAAGHIAALKCPEAVGNRHILSGGNIWWTEVAAILREEFKPQGYNVPTSLAPKFSIRIYSWFDKDAKMILSGWNKESKLNNTRMKEVLKIEPRDLKTSITDMAYSLIEAGLVKRTRKYHGPNAGGAAATEAGEGATAEVVPTSNGPTNDGEVKAAETKGEEDKADEKTEGQTEEKPAEEGEKEEEVAQTEQPAEETPATEPTELTEAPAAEAPAAETPTEEKPVTEAPAVDTPAPEDTPAAEESKPTEQAPEGGKGEGPKSEAPAPAEPDSAKAPAPEVTAPQETPQEAGDAQ